MTRSLPLCLILLAACTDKGGTTALNSDPTLNITSPSESSEIMEGAPVELRAEVSDPETDPTALEVTWFVDGVEACSSVADADGTATCETSLEADATISAEVLDGDGGSAEDSVAVTVTPNDEPLITILEPQADGTYYQAAPIDLAATVSDTEDDPTELVLTWLDGDTVLEPTGATTDSGGSYSATVDLAEGSHVLKAIVEDSLGKQASATVTIDVWGENAPPSCVIDTPTDGESFALGETVTFTGSCSDAETGAVDLVGTVGSNLDGELVSALSFDSAGEYSEPLATLTAGVHQLTLTVTDGYGDQAVETVNIEVCGTSWYEDADNDGYGAAGTEVLGCEAPEGFVDNADDCDDTNAFTYPGAAEEESGTACMTDADEDGFGDSSVVAEATAGTDCDDADADIHPDATEICDEIDNDCDGFVDDDDSSLDTSTQSTWYADVDNDGYGDAGSSTMACAQPSGTVSDNTDCDDGEPAANPGESEICDEIDNDCDGLVDDDDSSLDTSTQSTWYADVDNDGYGDASSSTMACAQPSAYVSDPGSSGPFDCDDTNALTHPAATELCDGQRNDCDDTAWTSDAGLASWYDDTTSTWSDYTSTLGAGSASSPASITLSDSGLLNVCEGTWYAHLTIEDQVDIVGVDGADLVVLDGANLDTVVTIQTDSITVSLTDLTITGGDGNWTPARLVSSLRFGGGVYCEASSNLDLDGLILTGNHADVGGGVAAEGCDVVATDVTWSDNTADTVAAGAWAYSAVWLESGGWYANNAAPSGGGAYYYTSDATLVDTTFTGNTATTGGYAALMVGYSSTLDASNLTVSGSQSGTNASGGEYYGGAVWLYSDVVATIDGATFDNNNSDNIAGALYVYVADVTCTDCAFDGNTALGSGGAAYVRTGSTLSLQGGCPFTNNSSDASGGALLVTSSSAVEADGAGFEGNEAGQYGGAIYQSSGSLTLKNGYFLDNNVPASTSSTRYYGGSLYLDNTDLVTEANEWIDSVSDSVRGGLIYMDAGTWSSLGDEMFWDPVDGWEGVYLQDVSNTQVDSMAWWSTGQFIDWGVDNTSSTTAQLTIDSSLFQQLNSLGYAIWVEDNTDTDIDLTTFQDYDNALNFGIGSSGSPTLTVTNSTFQDNVIGVTLWDKTAVFSGNTFSGSGGVPSGYTSNGIMSWYDATCTSTGDSFTQLDGWALALFDSSSGSVSTGTFSNNAFSSPSSSSAATIYGNTSGTLTVTSSTFSGNTPYDSSWRTSSGYDTDTWGSSASFTCSYTTGCY